MSDILSIWIFSKSLQHHKYTHKLQRMSHGDLRKLYIQLLNLQYFAVAFKSTNYHADSSIYWHSLYEDILFACNGCYCPKQNAAHLGFGYYRYKRRMAMALDFRSPFNSETLKRNLRGEAMTKHLPITCWNYFVVNYWLVKSSMWLDSVRCQKADGDLLTRGRLVAWPGLGEETARKLWSKVDPETHLPTKLTDLFLLE